MSETELLVAFRDGSLPPARFHHVDHVHVAWLYLEQGAGLRFAADLQRYAAAVGAPGKYSESITRTLLGGIEARRAARPRETWTEFAAANPDLLVFKRPGS